MKNRSVENELLDNLELRGETLLQALESLAWINKWFGNQYSIIKSIKGITKKHKKPLRIIDIGCGGGDLVLAIASFLKKNKITFEITGIDGNSNSIAFAQKKCSGIDHINFLVSDILSPEFKLQPCDILISSHFMYHFSDDALIQFLKTHLKNISTAIIFSELKRSQWAGFLFNFISFLLPISKLAKTDGLLAIKRSFTKKEWHYMLKKAEIANYKLADVPLFRILVTIYPQQKRQPC